MNGKRPERHVNLLRGFGVVQAAVVYGKPAAAVLGIDFDETFAETDIAPAVILLCLHGGRNNWIDSDH